MEFPDRDSTNYAASIQELFNEFTIRIPEYRRDDIKVMLFAYPFHLEDSPDNCQIDLLELQADMDIKRGYSDNSLADFYKLYACGKFPNLSIMQEIRSPSLVAPPAVSNSFK